MKRLKKRLRQWKPVHLCWLFEKYDKPIPKYFIGGGDAAPQYEGSRISNATRTWQADEDLDVTDWTIGDDFCISVGWGAQSGKKCNARELRLRWRNVSDAGSFADLGNTGELTYNGTTDLVNDNALTEGESGLAATQATYNAGIERSGANAYTYANLAADEWGACMWAIDTSNALGEKQYEFELYNQTDAAQIAVCSAQITMGAYSGPLNINRSDTVTMQPSSPVVAGIIGAILLATSQGITMQPSSPVIEAAIVSVPSVADGVVAGESGTITWPTASVYVDESLTVEIVAGEVADINIDRGVPNGESITLSEQALVALADLGITVVDTVTLQGDTPTIQADIPLTVSVSDDVAVHGPDLVTNGEFDIDASSWIPSTDAILTGGSANPHSGAGCLDITEGGTINPAAYQVTGSVIVGKTYLCSVWVKEGSASSFDFIIARQDWGENLAEQPASTATSSWVEHTHYVTVQAGTTAFIILLRNEAAAASGDNLFFDLATIWETDAGIVSIADPAFDIDVSETIAVGEDVEIALDALEVDTGEAVTIGENLAVSMFANQADWPDIYVDASAGDGGVGSQADPYNNFADINWTTGGDNSVFDYYAGSPTASVTINLKKGEEWRETLTPGADGTATYPIIIQEYGSGAVPIINAANLIGTWTDASPPANSWQAACTTEPNQVFFDGVRGTKESSEANLNAEYEWFWDANVLYVYAASDPDTLYTSPGIEASARIRCIYIGGKDYITVNDVDCKYANLDNIGVDEASDNAIIDGVISQYAYWRGVQISTASGTCTGTIVKNSEISYSGGNGIWTGTNTNTTLISTNVVHHNCQLAIDGSQHLYTAGIKANGSSCVGYIVEYNTVYSDGEGNTGDRGGGIWTDTAVPAPITRFNKSYDNQFKGIYVELTSDAQVYYNLVWGNNGQGIEIRGDSTPASRNKIYNNVSYNNAGSGIAVWGDNTTPDCICDNLIRNNIVVGNTDFGGGKAELLVFWGGENDGTYGSGNVYEYNCFGAEESGFVKWAGVTKDTYDDFETAYGGSSYSVEDDPLMTNPGGDDFTLQNISPCINAGVDVSLTEDHIGTTVPYGAVADVGAYEFTGVNIDVSDLVTVTENTGRLIPISLDVLEQVTLTEYVSSYLELDINVSDTVTTGEDITVGLQGEAPIIEVLDGVSLAESGAITWPTASIYVDEWVAALFWESGPGFSALDSIGVSESVGVAIYEPSLEIYVYDLISTVISIHAIEDSIIATAEGVGVYPSEGFEIQILEQISITESFDVATADLEISVYDEVPVLSWGEVDAAVPLDVNVSDGITAGESVGAIPSGLLASTYDGISIAEALGAHLGLTSSVSEGVSIGEFTAGIIGPVIAEAVGSISVSESLAAHIGLEINVSETVSTVESVGGIVGPVIVTAEDTITTGESVDVEVGREASALEAVSIGESTAGIIGTVILGASESVGLSESYDVLIVEGFPQPNVSDLAAVGESVSGIISTVIGSSSDGISAGEAGGAHIGLEVNVSELVTTGESTEGIIGAVILEASDAIGVGESRSVLIVESFPQPSVVDSISIAENIGVSVLAPESMDISITQGITVGESVAVGLSVSLAAQDAISVSDAPTASISALILSAQDAVTASESVGVTADLFVLVADLVSTGESPAAATDPLEILVSDSITVAAAPAVYVVPTVLDTTAFLDIKGYIEPALTIGGYVEPDLGIKAYTQENQSYKGYLK